MFCSKILVLIFPGAAAYVTGLDWVTGISVLERESEVSVSLFFAIFCSKVEVLIFAGAV